MKALVLAGGSGSRLRPITHTGAKQLLPIGNRPVIEFALEAVRAAGISDVGMIVGATHREIRDHLGTGSRFGVELTYIHQPEPLGLAHAVLVAADFLGDDDFVMYLGDNLLSAGLGDFVDTFARERPGALVMLTPVSDPSQFGVAELGDDGRLVSLVEKPEIPPSDLALVGVYLFSPRVLDAVRAISPSARGELEITDAIQWLLDAGERVDVHRVSGWWKDTGRVEDLLDANRLVLDQITPRVDGQLDASSATQGRVVVEAGAQLVDSFVRGPAIIGANTRLESTFVGPYTSIASGCRLTGATIEHSIVLADCSIDGVGRIEDSLIGREVHVGRGQRRPHAHRLVLGDHSRIELT